MAAPRGRPREASADAAILDAAVQLVEEVGLAAVTTREIAARAGVGRQSLYRRWQSRDELIAAACTEVVGKFRDLPTTGSVRDDLVAHLSSLVERLSSPRQARIMRALIAARLSDPAADALFRSLHDRSRRASLRVVERAVERGDLPPDVDGDLLVGMVYGVIYHRLLVTGEPINATLVEPIVDAAVRTPPRRPTTSAL